MTPLHLAAQRGRYNLVGYLVDKGADVNIRDINGVRLILYAVCSHVTERGCSIILCSLREKLAACGNIIFSLIVV